MRTRVLFMMVMCGGGALAAQKPAPEVLVLEQTFQTGRVGIRAAELDPLGRTVLAGTFDGHIQVWSTASRKLTLRKRGDSGGFG